MQSDSFTEDLLSSVLIGAILGFSVFLLLDGIRLIDPVFQQVGLSRVGGRIGGVEFAVVGASLGAVLDFVGKLAG